MQKCRAAIRASADVQRALVAADPIEPVFRNIAEIAETAPELLTTATDVSIRPGTAINPVPSMISAAPAGPARRPSRPKRSDHDLSQYVRT